MLAMPQHRRLWPAKLMALALAHGSGRLAGTDAGGSAAQLSDVLPLLLLLYCDCYLLLLLYCCYYYYYTTILLYYYYCDYYVFHWETYRALRLPVRTPGSRSARCLAAAEWWA